MRVVIFDQELNSGALSEVVMPRKVNFWEIENRNMHQSSMNLGSNVLIVMY